MNEAAKAALADDASDNEAFEVREKESDNSLEDVVKDLKRRGKYKAFPAQPALRLIDLHRPRAVASNSDRPMIPAYLM